MMIDYYLLTFASTIARWFAYIQTEPSMAVYQSEFSLHREVRRSMRVDFDFLESLHRTLTF